MKNNQIQYQQLNESFIGAIKKGLVKTRQQLGLKKYGNLLPEKPEDNSKEQPRSGSGTLFSYDELLKDSRPKRIFNESDVSIEELTEAFIQKILSKVKNIVQPDQPKELVIQNYPAKQQKLDKIDNAKNQIKKQLMGLDMELERINTGKHKGFNSSEVGKFNSSKLLPKPKKHYLDQNTKRPQNNQNINIYA
jgi:hypothetical protein